MNLVDDYLRAIAVLLPREKRDDIIEELRELILSRLEAREAELGRALTDDETEEVLRRLGHPLAVAARYRDGPQHLVGPALYPYWMFAVRAAVTIELALAALVFLVRVLSGDVARAGNALSSGFTGALILIGLATVVAWMIDRQALRIHTFENWRVKDLRFLSFAAWDADAWSDWLLQRGSGSGNRRPPPTGGPAGPPHSPHPFAAPSEPPPRSAAASARPDPRDPSYWGKRGGRWSRRLRDDGDPRRRVGSPVGRGLGGIAAGVVLLLWWVGAIHFGVAANLDDFHSLGLEPGALAAVDWAGIKAALYLPVLAYVGLVVSQGVVRIAHPDARRVHGLIDLAVAAVILLTVGWLWTLSPIASAVQVDTLAAFSQRMRTLFEDGPPFPLAPGLTLALVVVSFGGVIRAVHGLFDLVLPGADPWPPLAQGRPV